MEIFKPIFLIVPTGMDIVDAIIDFSHKRDVSIAVHHASGAISKVNILNSLSPSNYLSFQGNLHMFYLSGFYTKSLSPFPPENIPYSFFNIQFSKDWTHQIYGGLVGQKLIAAEPVHIMVSMIKKHEYHKVVNPITYPNVQPVTKSTQSTCYVANGLNGITNNTTNHPSFSVGASSSSLMKIQPYVDPPRNVNMLYWPNVQLFMKSTHATSYVANALNGITNNTTNHSGFSIEASSSSSMNIQPHVDPPRDVNMFYWNKPTN
uniref:PPC domain-containing protein n=1 Tax=Cajanus cajan TaxID=3821 RepID=A0A151RHK4_CAJCA|nr:hypothetical protein KK1_036522 [Cajanus cajan]